jgi:hypothetical protein
MLTRPCVDCEGRKDGTAFISPRSTKCRDCELASLAKYGPAENNSVRYEPRSLSWNGERRCGQCRDIKPDSAYYSDSDAVCRSCIVGKARVRQPEDKRVRSRRKHLKREYGLDPSQVLQMLERQNGRCAICALEMTPPGSAPTSMCVDHSHETNRVRQLLCSSCNKLLGFAKDDPVTLHAAIRYLREHAEALR